MDSFGDNCSKDSGTWSSPPLPACGAGSKPLSRLPRQKLTTALQIPAHGAACLGLEVRASLAVLAAPAALAILATPPALAALADLAALVAVINSSNTSHQQCAPRVVRDSVGGSTMDMWCLDGIGRGSWEWDMSKIVVRAGHPSPRGDESRGCYASFCRCSPVVLD